MREWLENIIAAQDALLFATRAYRDNDTDENLVYVCGRNIERSVHIFEGIERLAKACSRELHSTEETDHENAQYWFDYNGVKVFQLK